MRSHFAMTRSVSESLLQLFLALPVSFVALARRTPSFRIVFHAHVVAILAAPTIDSARFDDCGHGVGVRR